MRLWPDKAIGAVEGAWEGGYVRIRLYVGKYGEAEDLTIGNWGVKLSDPKMREWNLTTHLF